MTLTKKQIWPLILLSGVILALLASVYLAQQRQEIRPRATAHLTPTPTPIIIGDPECGLKGGVCRSTCQTNETEIQAQGCSSSQPKCCKLPTITPTPTPPSGRGGYTIDVGDKQSLVINIGAAVSPQIKFKAKLSSLRSYPDMYLRLRVKDELAFLDRQNSSAASSDTCNNPIPPDKDFYIPVKANGDVYSPVQQISQPAPAGVTAASVTVDGWVILDGVVPGRYYSLLLKGPKTRKSKMVEHFLLQPNQTTAQDFDWTEKPLDPGDLPDPNNGNKQDCTINSTDWSLQKARIGSTDGTNLAVCDVNYDGICNAGDSVAILDTLSKRPDDDL